MESFFVVYLSFSLPIVFNITNNVACRTGNGRSNGSYNNDHWSVPYGVSGGSFDLVLAIDIGSSGMSGFPTAASLFLTFKVCVNASARFREAL